MVSEMPLAQVNSPRISAYVLVADPNFLAESVQSYYGIVDKIVLSYDSTATSWTGTRLPLDACLETLASLDVEGKCVHAPGRYSDVSRQPFDNETAQRQAALDLAGENADWVLQLDTDEVLGNPVKFHTCLARADSCEKAMGFDYPARWLYSRIRSELYLERCTRRWQVVASYPGPVAVRSGVTLRHARQADIDLFRVDFAPRNTDPWHPRNATVDEVVSPSDAIFHYSWVRSPGYIRRKFGWSGHSDDLTRPQVYRDWLWHSRHPLVTVSTAPISSRERRFRLSRITEPPDAWKYVTDEGDPS